MEFSRDTGPDGSELSSEGSPCVEVEGRLMDRLRTLLRQASGCVRACVRVCACVCVARFKHVHTSTGQSSNDVVRAGCDAGRPSHAVNR